MLKIELEWNNLNSILLRSAVTPVFPDSILQNLILRTRSCGSGFITQSSWGFHFHLTIMVRWKYFVPQLYQFRRGISGGPALKHLQMMHRGRRWGGAEWGGERRHSHSMMLWCNSWLFMIVRSPTHDHKIPNSPAHDRTTRSVEDETQNGHWNANRNPKRNQETIVLWLFSNFQMKRDLEQ